MYTTIGRAENLTFTSFEELRHAVDGSGGLLTVTVGALCQIIDRERPGKTIRKDIEKNLRALGLDWHPTIEKGGLPNGGHIAVRLHKRDTPIADIIEAVLHPSPDNDALLRDAVGGKDADLLSQVRELVSR